MVAAIEDGNIPVGETINSKTNENVHYILNKLKENQHLGHSRRINIGTNEVSYICNLYLKQAKTESPLLELEFDNHGYAVIGDIHGQYNDIWRIVNESFLYGSKHNTNMRYLFLGDYVDRGQNSLETIMLLLCWKLLDPTEIYLLRGNHECRAINCRYGFLDELKSRFQPEAIAMALFNCINLCFDHMPIAAVLNNQYFAVHGGISPLLKNLDQIRNLQYPISGDGDKLVNDLLWADPSLTVEDFENNPVRGPKFGEKAVDDFFQINPGMCRILRAHQFIRTGVRQNFNGKVVTIFSAPNYRTSKNIAGALMIRPGLIEEPIYIDPKFE